VVSDVERRALALTGSGDLIWDWDVSADKVFTKPETESLLGLNAPAGRPRAKWLEVLHRSIRIVSAQRSTACSTSAAAGWCRISGCARPTATSCGSRSRRVRWSARRRSLAGGRTLTDVTESKNAEERLLHDSVHDQSHRFTEP